MGVPILVTHGEDGERHCALEGEDGGSIRLELLPYLTEPVEFEMSERVRRDVAVESPRVAGVHAADPRNAAPARRALGRSCIAPHVDFEAPVRAVIPARQRVAPDHPALVGVARTGPSARQGIE